MGGALICCAQAWPAPLGPGSLGGAEVAVVPRGRRLPHPTPCPLGDWWGRGSCLHQVALGLRLASGGQPVSGGRKPSPRLGSQR